MNFSLNEIVHVFFKKFGIFNWNNFLQVVLIRLIQVVRTETHMYALQTYRMNFKNI